MAVLSYLVFPDPGKKGELSSALSELPNCDVIPAENRDLFILVSECETKEDEAELKAQLEAIPSLAGYSLAAGFDENPPDKDAPS